MIHGTYVTKSLTEGETILYRAHLHRLTFLLPITIAIVLLLASLKTHTYFLVFLGILFILFPFINYRNSEFVVTSKRVIIKTGFFSRKSFELLLPKVEGVLIKQSIIGRLLNCGTLLITGTGGSKEIFKSINKPLDFRRALQTQLEAIGALSHKTD